MGSLPTGTVVWSLKRYTRDRNLWDRTCFRCKHTTPTFEYEQRDQEERPVFSYLCDICAQKKLAEWLQCTGSPDYALLGYLTDFDADTLESRTTATQAATRRVAGIVPSRREVAFGKHLTRARGQDL